MAEQGPVFAIGKRVYIIGKNWVGFWGSDTAFLLPVYYLGGFGATPDVRLCLRLGYNRFFSPTKTVSYIRQFPGILSHT